MSKPPIFCCGWRSPWCVTDTIIHRLACAVFRHRYPKPLEFVCDKHEEQIVRELPMA